MGGAVGGSQTIVSPPERTPLRDGGNGDDQSESRRAGALRLYAVKVGGDVAPPRAARAPSEKQKTPHGWQAREAYEGHSVLSVMTSSPR